MFNPAVETGTKLCNMKPVNYFAVVVYLRNNSSPLSDQVLGTKNFSLFQRSMASDSPIYDEKRWDRASQ